MLHSFCNQLTRNLCMAGDNYYNCLRCYSGQTQAILKKLNVVLNLNHMAPIIKNITNNNVVRMELLQKISLICKAGCKWQ